MARLAQLAEESDLSLHIEPVALNQIVQETVLRFIPRADALGVDLGVQVLESPLSVLANPALLEGALGNLIDNALRYGRAVAGQLSTVTVTLEVQGPDRTLSVIDNGSGLSPQQQRDVLQRGARGEQAPRLGQGAGLGLSIVSKFAQVMYAQFELSPPTQGQGLRASLIFKTGSPAPAARGLAA